MNEDIKKLASLRLVGDIIPAIWFKKIIKENGKPHLLAINILSNILYWYRPKEVRDPVTNEIKFVKKFKGEFLQKSYQSYANYFGMSRDSIKDAIVFLENLGLIERVVKNVTYTNTEGSTTIVPNVLFLKLNIDKVIEITTDFEVEEADEEEIITDIGENQEGISGKTLPDIGENSPEQIHRLFKDYNNNNNKKKKKNEDLENFNDDNITLRERIDRDFKTIFGRNINSFFEMAEFERLYTTYGKEKVQDAMRKAKIQNKFSIAYIEGILKNNGDKKKQPIVYAKKSRIQQVDEMFERILKRQLEKNKGVSDG